MIFLGSKHYVIVEKYEYPVVIFLGHNKLKISTIPSLCRDRSSVVSKDFLHYAQIAVQWFRQCAQIAAQWCQTISSLRTDRSSVVSNDFLTTHRPQLVVSNDFVTRHRPQFSGVERFRHYEQTAVPWCRTISSLRTDRSSVVSNDFVTTHRPQFRERI